MHTRDASTSTANDSAGPFTTMETEAPAAPRTTLPYLDNAGRDFNRSAGGAVSKSMGPSRRMPPLHYQRFENDTGTVLPSAVVFDILMSTQDPTSLLIELQSLTLAGASRPASPPQVPHDAFRGTGSPLRQLAGTSRPASPVGEPHQTGGNAMPADIGSSSAAGRPMHASATRMLRAQGMRLGDFDDLVSGPQSAATSASRAEARRDHHTPAARMHPGFRNQDPRSALLEMQQGPFGGDTPAHAVPRALAEQNSHTALREIQQMLGIETTPAIAPRRTFGTAASAQVNQPIVGARSASRKRIAPAPHTVTPVQSGRENAAPWFRVQPGGASAAPVPSYATDQQFSMELF